jgi:hypothetical protein
VGFGDHYEGAHERYHGTLLENFGSQDENLEGSFCMGVIHRKTAAQLFRRYWLEL